MSDLQSCNTSDATRKIVRDYFLAWTSQRVEDAYSLLAPNLHFSGPSVSYETADDFRLPLDRFAALTKSARIVEFVVTGDRAAMLYECELPQPAGWTKIASFFRVRNGQIYWYETQFDMTEFRRVLVTTNAGK